jgi:hypothetical protein
MPVHQVPRADLETKVVELERNGDTIVCVAADGDRFVIVSRPAGRIERR